MVKNKHLTEHAATDKESVSAHRHRRQRSTKHVVLTALLALAVVIALFGGVFNYMRQFRTVPLAQAALASADDGKPCASFREVDLQCQIVLKVSEKPVGSLLSQSEKADSRVKKRTNVVLTYSRGAATVKVPLLAGAAQEDLAKTLWLAGLTMGTVTTVPGNGAPAGVVVTSEPEAGTMTPNATVVNVSVSDGKVMVPKWTGTTKAYVTAQGSELNLNVLFKEVDSKKPQGVVLGQDVVGEAGAGSTVTVKVSRGPNAANTDAGAMPSVVGMELISAQSQLAVSGFTTINTTFKPVSKDKVGKILSQTPKAGATVNPVTTPVTLTVGVAR